MSSVVAFPSNPAQSVAEQLRAVADQIDAGEFGEVLSVSWVADCGSGHIEVGFVGSSPLPGAAAHMSLALGMRKLEV
jgi:ABC-type taurine transport system substrate-binding protein